MLANVYTGQPLLLAPALESPFLPTAMGHHMPFYCSENREGRSNTRRSKSSVGVITPWNLRQNKNSVTLIASGLKFFTFCSSGLFALTELLTYCMFELFILVNEFFWHPLIFYTQDECLTLLCLVQAFLKRVRKWKAVSN